MKKDIEFAIGFYESQLLTLEQKIEDNFSLLFRQPDEPFASQLEAEINELEVKADAVRFLLEREYAKHDAQ